MTRIKPALLLLAFFLAACVRHEDIRATAPRVTANVTAEEAPVLIDSVDFTRRQDTLFFANSGLALSLPLKDLMVDLSQKPEGTLTRSFPDSLSRVYLRFALMLDLLRDSLVEVRFTLKGKSDSCRAVLTVDRDSARFEMFSSSGLQKSPGILSATIDKQWLQLSIKVDANSACFREESDPAQHIPAPLLVLPAPGPVGSLVVFMSGHQAMIHLKNIRVYE